MVFARSLRLVPIVALAALLFPATLFAQSAIAGTVHDATGSVLPGVTIEASSDALIFNNLIYANDRGILISGDSPRAQVINNTVADN